MQVVNKKMCVIVILVLVIIESCTLFLMYKSFGNKNTSLDEVNLNKEINSNMFAIMLEQEDGTYKEDTSNTWPTEGYSYNADMSGCIDINGNKLDGVLTYDSTNNIASVNTTDTSFCYLYFDIMITTETLPSVAGSDMWDSTLEGDGYRYIGTNPNNYICFGTTSKSECINDTDKYMYRIIGIFEDGEGIEHIKLIKKEALNTAYAWHSDYSVDIDWDESDLYNGINGEYFLNNTAYPYMQDANWTDKIATWDYTAVNTLTKDNQFANYGTFFAAQGIYSHEINRSETTGGEWKTVTSKLGLMYASDYALALGESVLTYTQDSYCDTFKTGWIHISNNDSEVTDSVVEWTMARYGLASGKLLSTSVSGYAAWQIDSYGAIWFDTTSLISVARPVFYLTNDIAITGTGTIDDPYIIN